VTPLVPTEAPTRTPHLSATRFVAFGDSITEGFVEACPGTTVRHERLLPFSIPASMAQGRSKRSPTAYPVHLQALLSERYTTQEISVVNEGLSGETIEAGVAALPRILTGDPPEVLLLHHGVHTINTRQREAIAPVVDGLRRMIQEARSRGIVVLVGTLLPQRPGSCRAFDHTDERDDVVAANVLIRPMVGSEGALLVDLYEAFNNRTAVLIGQDGLHPSAAGYRAIAETFFLEIQRRLEQ
jgi:lysophospholipase L1-like esterase